MLDPVVRRLIDPPFNWLGQALACRGWTANGVTLAGLALGLIAALSVALGAPGWALIPLLASRVMDALDGAVARATSKTDYGGYLDIWCDFVFYGAVPFAFAILNPDHAIPAAFLLLAFYVNGASFLGFSVMAEKQGLTTTAQGQKSLFYSAGLLEGTETIVFFVVLCLFPAHFPVLAWIFGALCLLTAVARVANARHQLNQEE